MANKNKKKPMQSAQTQGPLPVSTSGGIKTKPKTKLASPPVKATQTIPEVEMEITSNDRHIRSAADKAKHGFQHKSAWGVTMRDDDLELNWPTIQNQISAIERAELTLEKTLGLK